MTKFCGKCGAPIEEGQERCPKCGEYFGNGSTGGTTLKPKPETTNKQVMKEDVRLNPVPQKAEVGKTEAKQGKSIKKIWMIASLCAVILFVTVIAWGMAGSEEKPDQKTEETEKVSDAVSDEKEQKIEKEESALDWLDAEPLSKLTKITTEPMSYEDTYSDYLPYAEAFYSETETTIRNRDNRNGIICAKQTDLDQNKKPELLVMMLKQDEKEVIVFADIYEKKEGIVTKMDSVQLTRHEPFETAIQYGGIATIAQKPYLYTECGLANNNPDCEVEFPAYKLYGYTEGSFTQVYEISADPEGSDILLRDLKNQTKTPVTAYLYEENRSKYGKYKDMSFEKAIREALSDIGLKPTDNYMNGVGLLQDELGYPTYLDTGLMSPLFSYKRVVDDQYETLTVKTHIEITDLVQKQN